MRELINENYRDYLDSFDTGKIHSGYFSIDKKRHEVDSTINDKIFAFVNFSSGNV